MSNQYWRSPETVRRLNGFARPGFAADFLCHSAAYRCDCARARRQFTRDSAYANAAWARPRENRRRDILSFLSILPDIRCWSVASQRSLWLSNALVIAFRQKSSTVSFGGNCALRWAYARPRVAVARPTAALTKSGRASRSPVTGWKAARVSSSDRTMIRRANLSVRAIRPLYRRAAACRDVLQSPRNT